MKWKAQYAMTRVHAPKVPMSGSHILVEHVGYCGAEGGVMVAVHRDESVDCQKCLEKLARNPQYANWLTQTHGIHTAGIRWSHGQQKQSA